MSPRKGAYLLFIICATIALLAGGKGIYDEIRSGTDIASVVGTALIFSAAMALVFLGLAVLFRRGSRCPNCREDWVLEPTGMSRREKRGEEVELRCIYCGHTFWRIIDD